MTKLLNHHHITEISLKFQNHGISSFFVGGFVRDSILGIESDDIDICLVGVDDKKIVMDVLNSFDFVDSVAQEVGEKFPVWIADINGNKIDFALARGEKKIGVSRKDFQCFTKNVSIEDDLLRRDLTINAIAKEILTGKLVDPFGGVSDLKNKIANPVSEAFREDSLRVLRTARFCSRFQLEPSDKMLEICRSLKPTDISSERVGMELIKMLKQSKKPSLFFRFLLEVDWLKHFFIEVENLVGIPQSKIHHPEGDAFEHTMHCMDATNDPFIRMVMLCHDLGKSEKTQISENGKITSIGHEIASVPLAINLMKRIKFMDHKTQKQICVLVELHMIHSLNKISEKVARRTLRKLINSKLDVSQLVEVCRCDVAGRPPLPATTPNISQDRMNQLLESGLMVPVVTGKKLIDMGFKPSAVFKKIIDKGLELQDRGSLNQDNWKHVLKGTGLFSKAKIS